MDTATHVKGTGVHAHTLRCYCGGRGVLRDSKYGPFYGCEHYPRCQGSVGCHPGTTTPLGSMADPDTKRARMEAHAAFDALWKPLEPARRWRGRAYRWLSEQTGIDDPHVGEMDEATALEVAALCVELGPEDLVAWHEGRT